MLEPIDDPVASGDQLDGIGPYGIPEAELPKRLEAQEVALIDGIKADWAAHGQLELELRFRTGAQVNALKADRVDLVSARLAYALEIAPSELSRMRKFARLYPSLEAFLEMHKEATTWSKVREVLDKQGTDRGKKTGGNKPPRTEQKATKAVLQAVAVITENLPAARGGLTFADFSVLKEARKRIDALIDEVEQQFRASLNEDAA